MLLWGPGLDAELEFRRERMAQLWGRPLWVDRLAGAPARRRARHGARIGSRAARPGVAPVALPEARSLALR
jgi:hypothetical protein